MPSRSRIAILIALAGLATPALAQYTKGRQPERPDMPPAPPLIHRVGPAYTLPTDTNYMKQVNTNAQGMNIIGDAANEPSIAIDPTAPNRMVIGWRQFDTVTSNFRQAGWAWSNDGGRNWHFPGVLTPGNFRSDPVIETDSQGHFYYMNIPDTTVSWQCDIFRSEDGGQTWGPPVYANGGDREWMSIDKSGGVGDGNIYNNWNPAYSCCGNTDFGRDTSRGMLPWPTPIHTPTYTPLGGTHCAGPDGEFYFVGSGGGSGRLALVRSDTVKFAAQTPAFQLAVPISMGATVSPGFPGNPGGASGQAWVDVNRSSGPNRGHVYVCCLAGPFGTDPGNIMFARSTNQGATWSTAVRVNDDAQGAGHYQWFPSMSVAPGGRIDVTWNDTRNSLSSSQSQLFYSYSNDEGVTWSPNVALTPLWNSTVGWPQQNKIGDYYDQESDDVGFFIAFATTLNGEQDVYFMRVNDWDCNKNGIPDSTDLAMGVLHDCNGNGIPDECEIAAGVVVVCPCYANCDGSTIPPVLNVNDFICFQNKYSVGDPTANCDGSTIPPVLNVNDFTCFLNKYAVGCP